MAEAKEIHRIKCNAPIPLESLIIEFRRVAGLEPFSTYDTKMHVSYDGVTGDYFLVFTKDK